MKKLYSPRNEIELSLIQGILEGEDIPHFIHNYHFGSLRAGPLSRWLRRNVEINHGGHVTSVSEALKIAARGPGPALCWE